MLHEAIGASLYGGDLSKFPARLADAFCILQEENLRVEALKIKMAVPQHSSSKLGRRSRDPNPD
jgi:hypothetical protein